MNRPIFSCVIPVKGKRPFFAAAMESLISQGMGEELEIIVQDADVEPDGGQSDALNRGFAKARGEWLFWLNADDLLLEGALKKVAQRIKNAGEGESWITGNELFIDAQGNRVGCSIGCHWHDWLYRHAVPHVHGPSAFFRRELLEKVGGFDASLEFCMDWDMWIRFMQAGARFLRIDDFLWAQRRWTGSKTQRKLLSSEQKIQSAENVRMLRKNNFRVTYLGVMAFRLWRLITGCYMRELAYFLNYKQTTIKFGII